MGLPEFLAQYSAAWLQQQPASRLVVAICGWADTGKSTLAMQLCGALAATGVDADRISTDGFMKDRVQRNALGITGYNPLSIDAASLASALHLFAAGKRFAYHAYDNWSGTRAQVPRIVEPCRVLVVEGIHALHPAVAGAASLKVFIDGEEPTLRELRRRANVAKRGMRPEEAGLRIDGEWADFCAMVLPRRRLADMLVRVSPQYEYSLLPHGG